MKRFLSILMLVIIAVGSRVYAMDEDDVIKTHWIHKSTVDLGKNDSHCEECGTKIRYVYTLEHKNSKKESKVGSECAERMLAEERHFRWEPREWDNTQWTMKKVSPVTGKTSSKILAYAYEENSNYFYNVSGKIGPYNTIVEAKKAAIKEYLKGKK